MQIIALFCYEMKSKPVCDHLGHKFKSLENMARAYCIEKERLRKRLAAGWDIKRALTTPVKVSRFNKPVIAPNGKRYMNCREMCKAYHIEYRLFITRVTVRHWTMEDALNNYKFSGASIPAKDHKGNIYHSLSEMARAYNLKPTLLFSRLNAGWSIEKALTTKTGKHETHKKFRPEYDAGLD